MERCVPVFEHYANYLADCIADIKFMDKDNLKEYLKTHLNLFYSECLDDHLLPDLERRKNSLIQENQKLSLSRVEMEEQILIAKSKLKERKYVDTEWLAKANYAFRIKGVQMQNNIIEISKLNSIMNRAEKNKNIEKANSEDRAKLNCMKMEFTERFGKDAFIEFIQASELRLHEKFQNL